MDSDFLVMTSFKFLHTHELILCLAKHFYFIHTCIGDQSKLVNTYSILRLSGVDCIYNPNNKITTYICNTRASSILLIIIIAKYDLLEVSELLGSLNW